MNAAFTKFFHKKHNRRYVREYSPNHQFEKDFILTCWGGSIFHANKIDSFYIRLLVSMTVIILGKS